MCLVVFAWRVHPDLPLVVAANRDEFHARPASPLHWWPGEDIAGGRDLQAGGTWLAVGRDGRFATVTNYRENLAIQAGERSRGVLVPDYLTAGLSPLAFAAALEGRRFAGFSLLAGSPDELAYVSNRGDAARRLAPGIYGLSNASLDTPWSKVERSKARLRALLEDDAVTVPALFDLLADRRPSEDAAGPGAGLSAGQARAVSAAFVVSPAYGTRCSTVLRYGRQGDVGIDERRFDPAGRPSGDTALEFRLTAR